MPITPFKLERYYAKYEFTTRYMLSSSDCEGLTLNELLGMASKESLSRWQNLKLGYTESQGHPLLRQEIANLYKNISADQTLVAVPEEAIYVVMQTLLRPGDQVISITPTYQSLHEIARSLGCQVVPWQIRPAASGWAIDIKKLEKLMTPQTRLLVINFPNNPTGFLPERAQLDAILAIAAKHGVYVFSDEMYRLLELDPATRLPSVSDVYEKGISLSGLSKSFALPGLRIGWLTTRSEGLMQDWLTFKDYTTICNSAPSEILAIIALQNHERIVARNLEIIRRNIRLAGEFFEKHSRLVAWNPPQAGSIAFPKWLGAGSVDEFCRDVLEKCGVLIVPGTIFDVSGGYFRVGLGRENFPQALNQLGEYWRGA